MDVRLSDIDRAMIVGQMTVIDYLKRQVAELERQILVAILMTYGVDMRKEGAVLDLEHGVVRYEPPTNPES